MSFSTDVSLIGCVLLTGLLGCAHAPAGPPTSAGANGQNAAQALTAAGASPASAAQAGATSATSATAATSAQPASPASAVSPQFLHDALQIGFHPVKVNGETIFCREEVPVGTRFGRKQCLSPPDLAVMIQHEQEQRDLMRANCGGQGCGGPQSH